MSGSLIAGYAQTDVWVRNRTGADRNGQPTYGTATPVKGLIRDKQRLVRVNLGEQITAKMTVTLGPEVTIASGDQVSLDNEVFYDVVDITVARGLGGGVLHRMAFCNPPAS